ncbi:HAMP domain-containing histidine kinase [Phyllobacterium sp. 628]|uniref:sensor histidine kinase n=1 Tax=Phyllobacterium sp. 628 TaxID=2718938 RepID=UPI001662309E|nr:HAMP domain-containing sensor histidine kinase [Phyllobacterium sp. 628]QND51183.1 HAMP domain-containing histidine kinase [Phyllobacterium sp. 628]
MKKIRPRSLQWVLVRRLILLQAATLLIFIALFSLVLWIANPKLLVDNEAAVDVLKHALERDANGKMVVRETAELKAFFEEFPKFWYILRDQNGETLQQGDIPEGYANDTSDLLKAVDHAILGFRQGDLRPEAVVSKIDTKAGQVQIITSTRSSRDENEGVEINIDVQADLARNPDGTTAWIRVIPVLIIIVVALLLPIIIVMGVTTLVTTPAVVRRSLAGLVATATQAGRIDINNRAMQLPIEQVPLEITPLVQAFNHALARLGQGYDQHNRFLTDAAHELRTPIAILRTRAELLTEDPQSARLLQDIERLSHLAQQLLDRQLLDQPVGPGEVVDLVTLTAQIVADFAPLAIAAGYDLSFEPADKSVFARVNALQIEQAVANLIRNAIDHSGGKGTITVLVDEAGGIEVRDEGPGIPEEEHAHVFEPFYRLRPRSSGAGLGLNLTRQIARLHGGQVDILSGPWCGARLRLQLLLEKTV